MKKSFRLTGLALTVSSAAMLTACTSTGTMDRSDINNGSFDAASVQSADVKASPVDQTKRRPDTHPELRNGLWNYAQTDSAEGFSQVIETTVVEADEPGEGADTTSLLAYNPEVINVAQA